MTTISQPKDLNTLLTRLGRRVMIVAQRFGGLSQLTCDTVLHPLKVLPGRPRFEWSLILEQVQRIGVKSLSLTNLVAVFTGMVLALQFIVGLKRFGLELYSGQVVGISIVRELGPVLTSLMIAARVGSGITAEIGSMVVTEQILAIRAMGADPIAKLVFPRVFVCAFATPLLTIIADVVGIIGGLIVTSLEAGVSSQFYFDQIIRTISINDFLSGIGKTFFFGVLIGVIACYHGLNTERGTAGVGQATTKSVVMSSVAIFVADYFLTKLFLVF